jgi:HEPN domain-containing protein
LHDQVCFFCQQGAEKYLKALLEELGLSIPKTHDLERLLDDLVTSHAGLKRHRRRFRSLTGFAVATRYPGENATKRQSERAIRWIDEIRQDCRALLKIKP